MKLYEAMRKGTRDKRQAFGFDEHYAKDGSLKVCILQAVSNALGGGYNPSWLSGIEYLTSAFPILLQEFDYPCECGLKTAVLYDILIHLNDIDKWKFSKMINYVKKLEEECDETE